VKVQRQTDSAIEPEIVENEIRQPRSKWQVF